MHEYMITDIRFFGTAYVILFSNTCSSFSFSPIPHPPPPQSILVLSFYIDAVLTLSISTDVSFVGKKFVVNNIYFSIYPWQQISFVQNLHPTFLIYDDSLQFLCIFALDFLLSQHEYALSRQVLTVWSPATCKHAINKDLRVQCHDICPCTEPLDTTPDNSINIARTFGKAPWHNTQMNGYMINKILYCCIFVDVQGLSHGKRMIVV